MRIRSKEVVAGCVIDIGTVGSVVVLSDTVTLKLIASAYRCKLCHRTGRVLITLSRTVLSL